MINIVLTPSRSVDAEPYTTGDIIAKFAGIEMKSVNELIRRYKTDLEEFGILPFEKEVLQGRGQPRKIWHLNEEQATLLITYLDNTSAVREFKKMLVRQFTDMKRELVKRRIKLEVGKDTSKGLNEAIRASGIDMHGYEFSTFNSLVYKQALGVGIGKLRQARGIPKADAITHYLSADEADAIRRVKDQVIMLLELKMDYPQIKTALQRQGIIYQVQLTLPIKKKEVLQ
ncbi:MAG TPA: phage regulatory protein [Lactobacillus sp.]|nr:phage regulatory protein [Lactobacillus sp.]